MIGRSRSWTYLLWTLASIATLASLAWPLDEAHAARRVTAVDERTLHVPVSREQLTVLVFPASVLQAVTSAPGVELKTSDRHVIVSPVERPIDLVATTTHYVYVLMLEPEAKGADTVVIEDARLGGETGGSRAGHDSAMAFEDAVLELLRSAASGRWPQGSVPRVLPAEDAPRWTDLAAEQILAADVRIGSGHYEVRRYLLRNDASRPRSFREQEFYTGQEFGIALSRQVVEPGERMVVSVVLPWRERPSADDPLDRLDPDAGAPRGPK